MFFVLDELPLLLEEALVETCEASAMASLVLGHFVNGVVDGVRALLLCQLGDAELVRASVFLGGDASLEIALGVTEHLAQQLSEAGSVVSLLVSVALVGLGDFGVALAVCLASHGQVHANLAALSVEMVFQTLDYFLGHVILVSLSGNVNGSESQVASGVFHFLELVFASLADGALLGSLGTFVDISTNSANEFLLHNVFVLSE